MDGTRQLPGSARVPRADCRVLAATNFDRPAARRTGTGKSSFRRDAETSTRDACAPRIFAATLFLVAGALAHAEEVTYAEQIRPIFQSSCLNCHNPDKQKAGLDLSTYEAAMAGGDGGKVIAPGNASKSLLYRLITHAEEPAMPAKADKLPDSQIELIKKWIESGAPERTGGMAKTTQKAEGKMQNENREEPRPISSAALRSSFALGVVGAPLVSPFCIFPSAFCVTPMPQDLLLESLVRAKRAGAIAAIAGSPVAPLAAVSGQKQVLLFNTATLELAGVLPFPEGFVEVLKFSRDGQSLLAGGGIGAKLGRVVVWDVVSGRRVAEIGDEFDTVLAADISPDGSIVALGGPGRLVKIFSANSGALLHKMKKHTDWVTALSFTADGTMLVTGDRAGGLVVWDAQGREQQSISAHQGAITSIACATNVVATASEDGRIKLWDAREGRERKSWVAHNGGVRSVAFAADGRMVSCGRDRAVALWDANGNKEKQFDPFADVAMAAAFAGGKVIAGDWTGTLRAWTPEGKRVGELEANPPMLAERVEAVVKRLAGLEPEFSKVKTQREAAENSAARFSAALRAASDSLRAEEAAAKSGELRVAALEKKIAEVKVAAQKAEADLAQATQALPLLTSNASETANAHDTMLQAISEGGMAAEATDETMGAGAGVSDLEPLAAAAKAAAQALAQKQATLATANETIAVQSAALRGMESELSTAHADADETNTALKELRESFPAHAGQAKAAESALAKARQAETTTAEQLAAARAQLTKWRAAQVNTQLYAAREELAQRQKDCDRARQQADIASAEWTAAHAESARLEKLIGDAPERIKKCEAAIAGAREQVAAARAAVGKSAEAIAGKEALLKAADDFLVRLHAEAASNHEDASLVAAVGKTKETLDLLRRDLAEAQALAASRAEDEKRAGVAVANVEELLAQTRAAIAAEPDLLAKAQSVEKEVEAKTADARAAAAAAAEKAEGQRAETAKRVDELGEEYQTQLRAARAVPLAATDSEPVILSKAKDR